MQTDCRFFKPLTAFGIPQLPQCRKFAQLEQLVQNDKPTGICCMKLLNLTLTQPAANVALDEALLDEAENGHNESEVLRLWQPKSPIVVLGRSSPVASEVNLRYCDSEDIPVIRRCSGGSTILTAAGCLMYAVLLDYRQRHQLRAIDKAHEFVMRHIQQAIRNCGVENQRQGICDLTIGTRKVSGNALRCKKNWFIYHGTLVCRNMDLALISRCLGMPNREPEYRHRRGHSEFMTRIPVETETLADSLARIWNCDGTATDWPADLTQSLVNEKYANDSWTRKI